MRFKNGILMLPNAPSETSKRGVKVLFAVSLIARLVGLPRFALL
jgi:hypothetical protein